MGAPSRFWLHRNKSGIGKKRSDSGSSCFSLNRHLRDLRIVGKSVRNKKSQLLEMLETNTVAYYLQFILEKVCKEGRVPEFFKADEKASRLLLLFCFFYIRT